MPKDLTEFRFTVFVIFAVLAVGLKKRKKKNTIQKLMVLF